MHGGNLRRAQELYGLNSFIDLSANINPFGPPPGVWESLQHAMSEIVHYPDPESQVFRKILSSQLGLPTEKIMVGNGAGELIFTIVQALKPKKVVIPVPSFSEYERAAHSIGAEVNYIYLGPEGWQKLNCRTSESTNERNKRVDGMLRDLLTGCDLLFLCSPHNPTGSVLEEDTLEQILRLTKELRCRVLFDESFLDFLPDESRTSARNYMSNNEHLIVLYSLTKFYSIPGLRLGTVFAPQSLLACFEHYRDPWSVNVLAQYAGIAALQDLSYPDDAREKLQESRAYFYLEFARANFSDLRLWPTTVNFALIEVLDHRSGDLIQHLGRLGIMVRDCSNFAGLPSNFIRVAIKDVLVMQQLIRGLKGFHFGVEAGGKEIR